MRRTVPLVLLVLAALTGPGAAGAAGREEYIVVLRDGVQLTSALRDQTRRLDLDVFQVYGHALNGYAARLRPSSVHALTRDPRVLYVVRDRAVKLDAQETPTGIRRVGAEPGPRSGGLLGSSRGRGVGVAVIDTGIDLDHLDLGTVVPAANCLRRAVLPDDDNGHGTHVAGTIAALDNTIGVVGVAPEATLYALKAFNRNGDGTWSSIICAVDWVASKPGLIRVANMSFSTKFRSTPSDATCGNGNRDALHTAICVSTRSGVTYVASAGNHSADAARYVPAAYDEVIAISALADSDGAPGALGAPPACFPSELDDHFATFSNFGDVIELAAPGVCINSTTKDGGYAVMSGTSTAAPHVTGAASLYLGSHPTAFPAEVRSALLAAAEPGPIAGDPDSSHEGVVRVTALDPGIGVPSLPPVEIPAPPTAPEQPPLPPLPPVPPLP